MDLKLSNMNGHNCLFVFMSTLSTWWDM